MKSPLEIFVSRFLISACITAIVLGLVGCTAAQLGAADKSIGGTPVPPAIVNVAPASQPAVYVTIPPTTQQATFHLIQDAASEGSTIAAAIPTPWTQIAATAFSLLAGVAGAFYGMTKNNQLQTANNVIAAAAPGVAHLVSQVTDNATLATDVTTIAQIAPGIINLLSHPAADNALNAVATVQAVGINSSNAAGVATAKVT